MSIDKERGHHYVTDQYIRNPDLKRMAVSRGRVLCTKYRATLICKIKLRRASVTFNATIRHPFKYSRQIMRYTR